MTVFDSTFKAFNEFVVVDSTGTYRPGKPLVATTWWCIFDWYSIQTSNQTMGLYKMDHTTAKSVASRLQAVYRPFKASSENAVLGIADYLTGIPSEYRLEQNYPNPFNPSTNVRVDLPTRSTVKLSVFDLLGREIAVLMDGEYIAGRYVSTWNASRVATGAYYCRLVVNGRTLTRAMMLIK